MTDHDALRTAADILAQEAGARSADPTDLDDRLDELHHAATEARRLLAHLEQSRDTQPQRLADMRAQADTERAQARTDEPWLDTVGALPATDQDGMVVGMLGLPSINAKAIWGTRLAFDLVSRDLPAKQILSELFSDVRDIDHLMLIFAEACETLAESIVAPLLEVIETRASDYDMRVQLADAARNAWSVRCAAAGDTQTEGDQ
ncbi:hypothetical protein ABLE92_24435 [Gordonia sp. VNQ95]|uniref:hypothetical protein n=1 Tax=Gordonia sp. VNQ95 TaxID=3156619 RepID=UPI0032B4B37C